MPRSGVVPGSVWWCDGAALAFEAHFKRRPVLILEVAGNDCRVMPLSSKRRWGQEQVVTHTGGASFMTGAIRTIPASALHKPLGVWDGWAHWQAASERDRAAQEMVRAHFALVRAWLKRIIGRP